MTRHRLRLFTAKHGLVEEMLDNNFFTFIVRNVLSVHYASVLADLLLVQPHTPTPEPVRYEKKDGEWYTHDGVDIKESQQRKGKPTHKNCEAVSYSWWLFNNSMSQVVAQVLCNQCWIGS